MMLCFLPQVLDFIRKKLKILDFVLEILQISNFLEHFGKSRLMISKFGGKL